MLRSSYYLQQLRDILYIAPVVLIAIMGHEFAHGWVSDRLGDPTPRMDGRLTLNPLKHLDPFGTLCLIFFRMGWAKPVRINTRYYKNRKSGIIMVSLAGPFMNFILAFLSLLLYGLLGKYGSAEMLLKRAPEGTGVIAGGPARAVIELAGIKNIRTKCMGSRNKQNVVLATIEGLRQLKTPEEVARLRGKSVDEILA